MTARAALMSAVLVASQFQAAVQAAPDLAVDGVMRHQGVCISTDPVGKKTNYFGLVLAPFGDGKPLNVPEDMLRRQQAAYTTTLKSLEGRGGTSRVFMESQLGEFKKALDIISQHRKTGKPQLNFCGVTV